MSEVHLLLAGFKFSSQQGRIFYVKWPHTLVYFPSPNPTWEFYFGNKAEALIPDNPQAVLRHLSRP